MECNTAISKEIGSRIKTATRFSATHAIQQCWPSIYMPQFATRFSVPCPLTMTKIIFLWRSCFPQYSSWQPGKPLFLFFSPLILSHFSFCSYPNCNFFRVSSSTKMWSTFRTVQFKFHFSMSTAYQTIFLNYLKDEHGNCQ